MLCYSVLSLKRLFIHCAKGCPQIMFNKFMPMSIVKKEKTFPRTTFMYISHGWDSGANNYRRY